MLIKAGDPLRKLHTYAAVAEQAGIAATPLTQKRKHREIEEPAQETSEMTDKYSGGMLKQNKKDISKQLKTMLNDAGGKKFSGWPGKHAVSSFFSPSKPSISRPPDASCEPSGRGVKHQEDDTDAVDSPVDSNEERGEPAAKRPKRAVANKRAKRPHKNQRHVMTTYILHPFVKAFNFFVKAYNTSPLLPNIKHVLDYLIHAPATDPTGFNLDQTIQFK
ncbi:hypothetical protein PSTG_01368 [Puccinia striiformis f. sp. tritici PST-78]|uniref:Uncharacterized protein n=1 Tax=Puccinia striiformis f. sp. tritici PST-78 TaxID=1165861 RepID=A0A0L0W1Z1_9BASI|nr:hypothetical protein PSTG_01368 [Puccinia striiformis f. sp. tritici PST-78]